MKKLFILLLFYSMLPFLTVNPKVIEVCPSCPIRTIEQAASNVKPGDSILLRAGIYTNYNFIANLQGTSDNWITITNAPNEEVIFRGQSTAIQLSDPAYVRIVGLIFEAQTSNGVNIDDYGTYDTPAHHIIIENCEWRSINATGNNDMLKMSGVDSFIVRNCKFKNGSPGGSGIDIVGCHFGLIEKCRFENQGSNSIQTKGGASKIVIQKNLFINGGQRSLNIGGSTGLQYFRPQGVNYEASEIFVFSNIFIGSIAPIAFVTAVNCNVINNTVYKPSKWAIRILQETTESHFLKCGNNSFINNILYLENTSTNPAINIGSNTAPETFIFANNLWYNKDNPNWQGPNLPSNESNGIKNIDPMLIEDNQFGITISRSSPVSGKGKEVNEPIEDFFDNFYNLPRSIGAVEVNPKLLGFAAEIRSYEVLIFPNPAFSFISFTIPAESQPNEIIIYNSLGECVVAINIQNPEITQIIDISHLPQGIYLAKAGLFRGKFFKME